MIIYCNDYSRSLFYHKRLLVDNFCISSQSISRISGSKNNLELIVLQHTSNFKEIFDKWVLFNCILFPNQFINTMVTNENADVNGLQNTDEIRSCAGTGRLSSFVSCVGWWSVFERSGASHQVVLLTRPVVGRCPVDIARITQFHVQKSIHLGSIHGTHKYWKMCSYVGLLGWCCR